MSSSVRRNPLRPAGASVDVPVAVVTWLCGWLVANVAATVVLLAGGYDSADEASITALFIANVLGWAGFVAGMAAASQRGGSADFVADYGVRVQPIDAAAAAVGVLTQLVVLPLIYLPLEELWPATFSDDKLAENAKELVDRAADSGMVLLVLMVCVGAPLVEELVYRGLIQGSLVNRIHQVAALVIASAFFAVIHFRPVEYPGLFAAGLVFGACALVGGRLGPAIVAHAAFNITGLVLALD